MSRVNGGSPIRGTNLNLLMAFRYQLRPGQGRGKNAGTSRSETKLPGATEEKSHWDRTQELRTQINAPT